MVSPITWTFTRDHEATLYVRVSGECGHDAGLGDIEAALGSLTPEQRRSLGWVKCEMGDPEDEPGDVAVCDIGEIKHARDAARADVAAERIRLRTTAQILIAEVGADGAMDAEEAAQKAVDKLQTARAEVERLNDLVATLDERGGAMNLAILRMQSVVEAACDLTDGKDALGKLRAAVDTYRAAMPGSTNECSLDYDPSLRREPATPPAEALRQALVDEPLPDGAPCPVCAGTTLRGTLGEMHCGACGRQIKCEVEPPPAGAPEQADRG